MDVISSRHVLLDGFLETRPRPLPSFTNEEWGYADLMNRYWMDVHAVETADQWEENGIITVATDPLVMLRGSMDFRLLRSDSSLINSLLDVCGFPQGQETGFVELGPGIGYLTTILPEPWKAHWRGLEINPDSIRSFQQLNPDLADRIIPGTMRHFSQHFQNQKLVIAISALDGIAHIDQVLSSIYEGLAPGGTLLLAQTMGSCIAPVAYFNATHPHASRTLLPEKHIIDFIKSQAIPLADGSFDIHSSTINEAFAIAERTKNVMFSLKNGMVITYMMEYFNRLATFAEESTFKIRYHGTVVSSVLFNQNPGRYPAPPMTCLAKGLRWEGAPEEAQELFGRIPKIHRMNEIGPGQGLEMSIWDVFILKKPGRLG